MQTVTVFSKSWCPFCVRAKYLLANKEASVKEIDVEREPAQLAEMIKLSGRRTVPQIWIGETHVGGCDDLFALEASGKLDSLLAGD